MNSPLDSIIPIFLVSETPTLELFIIVVWLVFFKEYTFVIYILSFSMVFQNDRTYKHYYEKIEEEM